MNEGIKYSEHLYQRALQDTGALEKNAYDYPVSSLAGFLLLYHYKKNFHPGFDKLAQKIALQFNNSLWLQFQLYNKSNKKSDEEIISQNITEEIKEAAEEKISREQSVEIIPEVIEIKSEAIPETLHEQSFQQENEKIEIAEGSDVNHRFQKTEISETKLSGTFEEAIVFEPLHTVDYFASQGIKINEELVPNDKFSSQMKSFTEWLKSMKKLHPGRLAEQNIVSENLIKSAAEESNFNTEVLTEAMAEVLIKQDKKEKAIEMFTKLSLINPSKSAYFAAKIESIKSS